MANINVDLDKYNSLLEAINNTKTKLNTTRNQANRVNFPDGGINWQSIINELSDCSEILGKYSNWIDTTRNELSSCLNERTSNINKTNIEEIKIKQFNVK